jgi:adiponectin receptor
MNPINQLIGSSIICDWISKRKRNPRERKKQVWLASEGPKGYRSTHEDYEKLPKHLPEPYIMSAYRVNFTFFEALLSLFSWHNETVNIWTSLIPFVFFIVMVFILLFKWEMGSVYHTLAYVVFFAGAIYTYGASTLYHWFNCISSKHHQTLLRLDISGIGFLIMGSFYPPLYYSFHCHPNWGIFYLAMETIACFISSLLFIFPKFISDAFRYFRIGIFVSIVGSAIFPVSHLFYIYGFNNALFIETSSGMLQVILMYVIGIIFYATKFPERLAPGRFDVFFHSHQFWHTSVFLGSLFHLYNMLKVRASFDTHPCFGMRGVFIDNEVQHFRNI